MELLNPGIDGVTFEVTGKVHGKEKSVYVRAWNIAEAAVRFRYYYKLKKTVPLTVRQVDFEEDWRKQKEERS